MGTIYNRGTKHAPRWYIGFFDRDGKRKIIPSKQPTKEQARTMLQQIEANIAAGRAGIIARGEDPVVGPLLDAWKDTLHNRNAADDKRRVENDVRPMFGSMLVRDVTLSVVMRWIERMRAGTAPRKVVKVAKLSEASMRHNLNTLSRFFSWLIEHEHTTVNPVRMIPVGKRPMQATKRDVPWLDDEQKVRDLFAALPHPINLMFYIANRSGLRTGEVAGLRMSDLGFDGVLRVRFSYDGPLKEDKYKTGKVKWAPRPDDFDRVVGSHVKARKKENAGAEDYVFLSPARRGRSASFYRKEFIEQEWEAAREECGVDLTWYQSTRHAFVSRNMARGVPLDEVSAAVGHSSPVVTKRWYDHFVRRSFSERLTTGLALEEQKTTRH